MVFHDQSALLAAPISREVVFKSILKLEHFSFLASLQRLLQSMPISDLLGGLYVLIDTQAVIIELLSYKMSVIKFNSCPI